MEVKCCLTNFRLARLLVARDSNSLQMSSKRNNKIVIDV